MPEPDPTTSAAAVPAAAVPLAGLPLRTRVRVAIEAALARAIAASALPPFAAGGADTPTVEVERPANPEHGDLASSIALKLARPCRMAPLQIAEAIAAELAREAAGVVAPGDVGPSAIGSVAVAAPGFLNVRLSDTALAALVNGVLAAPTSWGRVRAGRPRRIDVEFVSANPTGPLHIGNARGAFVGDLLCRVLEAAGHAVTREYYFNDFGAQVRNLGASVAAVRAGEPLPEEAYRGAYVGDLAAELPADLWAAATAADADRAWLVGVWASERVRAGIGASLAHLGVRFDVWKSESSLYTDGWVDRAVERLRASSHLYEQAGALWFRSTDFGDDKDRVVRKSNGDFTYFGSDIGYVVDKFSRGFDQLVYIWGADHHGTVARLRNAAEAMGFEKAAVQMILMAWVRFVRDGVEVSMSKRSGEFITLDELLAEIGVDAARWFFAARGYTSGIDFDIELAKRQSAENPVYYVQYAHARIASILRKAAETGMAVPGVAAEPGVAGGPGVAAAPAAAPAVTPADLAGGPGVAAVVAAGMAVPGVATEPGVAGGPGVAAAPAAAPAVTPADLAGGPESALVRALARFPEVVEDAAAAEETQGITAFATELATEFHAFYRDARVVDPAAPERSAARLALVRATQLTLAATLGLLGISAPESM